MSRFLQKLPIQLLLIVPTLFYLTVAVYWHTHFIYALAGDEPHYLLITDSIVRDHDLRVENNYQLDTPVRHDMKIEIYNPELMPMHVSNQFSKHNIGLPLLLVVPYALAGVLGAKIFMALLTGLWPLLFYKILSETTESKRWSVIIAFALTIGLPFASGGNQITPDLPAGLIVLYVAWKIFRSFYTQPEKTLSTRSVLCLGAMIAFLPWLHLRLLAPASLLLLILIYAEAKQRRTRTSGAQTSRYLIPLALFISSFALLCIYNYAAFGSLLGPYDQGSLSLNPKKFLMIFFGLHWDQSQGMFMQQPLFLLGLVGIVPFVKAYGRAALLLGLLYLSLILPNAMHTAWYGGFSFVGRFGWSAAPLWVFPLACTVKSLLKGKRWTLKLIVIASLGLQVWLAMKWLFVDSFLIIEKVPVWATRSLYDNTGLLFALPSFNDFDLYLKHPPNYVFVVAGILLIVSGWLWRAGKNSLMGTLWTAFLIVGVSAIILLPVPGGSLAFKPYILPRQIGNNDWMVRVATEKDGAGMLSYGPYVQLLTGLYELNIEYESADTPQPAVGHFDVVYGVGTHVVGEADLPPSSANQGTFKYRFRVDAQQSLDARFEFRIWYPGHGTLRIKSMTLARV
ncbi:MAG TPA: hypothetical protein VF779_03805 [Pyrinomonadaceae bacterium]